jgi:hypothetical protein
MERTIQRNMRKTRKPTSIYPSSQPAESSRKKKASINPALIVLRDGRYEYTASDGTIFSINLERFYYHKIKTVLAKEMVKYEEHLHPNLMQIRNARFSNMIGFDKLRLNMQVNMIDSWHLSYVHKKGYAGNSRASPISKKILLTYFSAGKVIYIMGSDLNSIIKQIHSTVYS